jgi:hypothetical protein
VPAVRPDGALVLSRNADTAPTARTELLAADGTTTLLAPYAAAAAAVAADGTVFLAAGRIDRVGAGGSLDTLAGPGLDAVGLAVTPDGGRVSYVDVTDAGVRLVRSFAVGGDVRTVAGADSSGGSACADAVPHLLATADAVLVACGGVRSYPYDGSAAPRDGAVVAGRNDAPGLLDAPSGTPLAQAYLSRVADLAADPTEPGRVAMATRFGAYVVEGEQADAVLVRRLSTGATGLEPTSQPARTTADVAYGPDGTLYLFAPDPADPAPEAVRRWRLQTLGAAGGTPAVLASGAGTAAAADGANLTHTHLTSGHIAMAPDGTLYLGQGRGVYAIAPGSTAMKRVAQLATTGTPVQRLSVGPDGRLLVAEQDVLRRLDPDGVLRLAGVPFAGQPTAGTDGSFYFHVGPALFRQWPDGTATVALGRHPDSIAYDVVPTTPPVGVDLPASGSTLLALEPLPDGRLAVAGGADARVHLVRPGGQVWTGAAPTLTASATSTVEGHKAAGITATIKLKIVMPAAGPTWRLRATIATDPAVLSLTRGGYMLLNDTVGPGITMNGTLTQKGPDNWVGVVAYEGTTPIRPGDRFSLRLWAWRGDGSVAAPPISVTVAAPRIPAVLAFKAPTQVRYAEEIALTGKLSMPGPTGTPIPEQVVELQSRDAGGEWKRFAVVKTIWNGTFVHRFRPKRPQEYRAVHPTGWVQRAVSPTRTIALRYSMPITRTAWSAKRGERMWLTGAVSPGARGDEVLLQRGRFRDGAWTWRTIGRDRLDATGGYVFSTLAPSDVRLNHQAYYRVRRPAANGFRTGTSVIIHVTVRAA